MAENLFRLYEFARQQLLASFRSGTPERISIAIHSLSEIRDAWKTMDRKGGSMSMTKADFVAQLQSLSGELGKAIAARDFDRVRFIDSCRQELIQQFAADVTPDEDPEFFSSLECISEDMANSIATLKMEMAGLSKQASSKLRMLEGYRA